MQELDIDTGMPPIELYCVSQKERVWGNQRSYLKISKNESTTFTILFLMYYVYSLK